MTGLYFYQDSYEITFLQFFKDGRVMSFGKNTRYGEYFNTVSQFRIESDKVDYLVGRYWIGEDNRIKIKLEGEYKIEYRGTIKNVDTFDLVCRCQFTNHRKVVTFRRFSVREHLVHFTMQKRL